MAAWSDGPALGFLRKKMVTGRMSEPGLIKRKRRDPLFLNPQTLTPDGCRAGRDVFCGSGFPAATIEADGPALGFPKKNGCSGGRRIGNDLSATAEPLCS